LGSWPQDFGLVVSLETIAAKTRCASAPARCEPHPVTSTPAGNAFGEPVVAADMTSPHPITRRVVGIASGVSAVFGRQLQAQTMPSPSPAVPRNTGSAAGAVNVRLTVNAQHHDLMLDPRTSLLDALRDHLGLSGTKKGCDHGQCGACTVLVNGVRLNACMSLAVARDGDSIVTIEGVAGDGQLHPMQEAFVKHDGFQCGYCTPGQICSAIGMLGELERGVPSAVSDLGTTPQPNHGEIRERMSGNICRCAAYPNIVAAILEARGAGTGRAG
jgi:xanthine dehydrogenase YagT iron-sulfur-binding subunit